MDANRLANLAKRQDGLFTRRQAGECGYSPYQIKRRLAIGEWQPVIGSTYALGGLDLPVAVRDRAAQLAIPGSVLAGPSAARRWKMPIPDEGSYLYVGRDGTSRLPGVRLWRDMPPPGDLGKHGGVPTAWRERTVVDCVRLLPLVSAREFLDRALQQRWITVADFRSRVVGYAGRHGVGRVILLLREVVDGTRSVAERVTADILRRAKIQGWVANEAVYDERGQLIGVCDFVFAALMLVLEIDGRAFHVTPDQFQRDRTRQNRLQAAGWMVLRFTWRDITERPEFVVAQLRAAIARRAR